MLLNLINIGAENGAQVQSNSTKSTKSTLSHLSVGSRLSSTNSAGEPQSLAATSQAGGLRATPTTTSTGFHGVREDDSSWGDVQGLDATADVDGATPVAMVAGTGTTGVDLFGDAQDADPDVQPLATIKRSGKVKVALDEIDYDLIKEYKERGAEKETQPLLISLWDFGGQDVFSSLHHLFLTPNGAYCVVFNMHELLTDLATAPAGPKSDLPPRGPSKEIGSSCVQALKLWLDTVYVFAPKAPVLVVGTCKDQCTAEDLARVTECIEPVLLASPCSEQLVENTTPDAESTLAFFIDNSKPDDASVQILRQAIEDAAWKRCPYVQMPVPVEWIKVLDHFGIRSAAHTHQNEFGLDRDLQAGAEQQTMQHRLSLDDVRVIARQCQLGHQADVPVDDEMMTMLSVFHDMGLVTYFDEPYLRDMVILNSQWLIDAVSTIVRDFDLHKMPCDNKAARSIEHKDSWVLLKQKAKLRKSLTKVLWPEATPVTPLLRATPASSTNPSPSPSPSPPSPSPPSPAYTEAERESLLTLMQRFGLIVPFWQESSETTFLVPALLPHDASPVTDPSNQFGGVNAQQAIIVFDVDSNVKRYIREGRTSWQLHELSRGFLPPGLFPRLIGKAVAHSQQTQGTQRLLTRTRAILSFGLASDPAASPEVQIREDLVHNCLWITMEPAARSASTARIDPDPNRVLVLEQITQLLREVVAEYLHNRVGFQTLIPAQPQRSSSQAAAADAGNSTGNDTSVIGASALWVPYDAVLSRLHDRHGASFGEQRFSFDGLAIAFGAWFPHRSLSRNIMKREAGSPGSGSGCSVYCSVNPGDKQDVRFTAKLLAECCQVGGGCNMGVPCLSDNRAPVLARLQRMCSAPVVLVVVSMGALRLLIDHAPITRLDKGGRGTAPFSTDISPF